METFPAKLFRINVISKLCIARKVSTKHSIKHQFPIFSDDILLHGIVEKIATKFHKA